MIILFGIVGSGKSEQANRLVARLGCPYISTSRLIKGKPNSAWEKLIMSGQLLTDEDIFALLEPELQKIDGAQKEFILDGAPRSVGQAEWLSRKIKAGQIKLTAIIYLKVSREVTVQRLMKRGREDDKEEIISERFRQYEAVTRPVLDYLKAQGFEIHELDGEWSADVVEQQIWKVLKDKLQS